MTANVSKKVAKRKKLQKKKKELSLRNPKNPHEMKSKSKQRALGNLHGKGQKLSERGALHRKVTKPLNNKNEHGRKKEIEIAGEFTLIRDVIPHQIMQVERVLPHWLLHPIPVSRNMSQISKTIKESCPLLGSKLVKKLSSQKITHLFPVQQTVIPQVLTGLNGVENRFRPRDICVATPTGSGKTLAFVLPILQVLCKRTVPAIRALVILPVIELAKQVYNVFSTYAPVFKLQVGHMFGKEIFSSEQESLVQKVYRGYHSKVDILVATPGRLMKHIMNTPGLDFSQLRFLVLDEADRLLAGEDGELIGRIQRHLMQFKSDEVTNPCLPPCFRCPETEHSCRRLPSFEILKGADEVGGSLTTSNEDNKASSLDSFSQTFDKECIAREAQPTMQEYPSLQFSPPLQRLLFSATLTHNPAQLQNVALYRPILFTTDSAPINKNDNVPTVKQKPGEHLLVARPSELVEGWVKTDNELKLITAHYLLKKEAKRCDRFKAIVFATSIELTSKVARLLLAMSKGKYTVEEFSSKHRRNIIIKRFLRGNLNVLVSSDAMARGIDVPDIDCVISFDVPSASMYVHRIGRTARAGKPGKAISLVTEDDFRHFKKMMRNKFENVTEVKVESEKLVKYESSFRSALVALSQPMALYTKKGKLIRKTLRREGSTRKK